LSSTDYVVVLLPGTDTRVLGVSSRTRNARVAARAGATVIDAQASGAVAPEGAPTMLVPATLLIDGSLFTRPAPTVSTQLTADGAAVFDISTRSARLKASWVLLGRTVKPTDGWFARSFNRPISRIVSFILLSMGLAAGHASVMTLIVGLLGAAIAARPGYLGLAVAGLLFQVASVLDGVDGEMARATLTESDAGARLDTIVDQITYVAFFIGVTIGWAREDSRGTVLFWIIVVGVALVGSLLRAALFVSRHAPNASWVFIDRSIRRAAQDSRRVALRAAAGVFTLLRRDVFAMIFFLVSLTGIRAFIPGLVAFGAMVANFTLSRYDEELTAAAVKERSLLSLE
jgi:phosphatidylglycerophosphate synthase